MGRQIEKVEEWTKDLAEKGISQIEKYSLIKDVGNGQELPLFGIEVEVFSFDEEGYLKPGIYKAIAALRGETELLSESELKQIQEKLGLIEADKNFTYEIGPHQGEIAIQSPEFTTYEGFKQTIQNYREKLELLQKVGKEFGLEIHPTSLPEKVRNLQKETRDVNATPRARYSLLIDSLKRMKGKDIQVYVYSETEGQIKLGGVNSVGIMNSLHTTVSFPDSRDLLSFYNNMLYSLPLLSAIDANSEYLAGHQLQWKKSTIDIFEQCVDVRKNKDQPKRCGQYWEKLESWQELLDYKKKGMYEGSFEPLLVEENPQDTFEIWWGTLWDWIRPRVKVKGDEVEVYAVEVRTADQQDSIEESVAIAAYTIGVGLNPLTELDVPEMEENFYRSAMYGKDALVNTQKGYLRIAELLPQAYEHTVQGLSKYMTIQEAEEILAPIRGRFNV